jgi:hypothetical protein
MIAPISASPDDDDDRQLVADGQRHHRREAQEGRAAGEAVEPVGEVDRVGHPDQEHEGERHRHQAGNSMRPAKRDRVDADAAHEHHERHRDTPARAT